MVCKCFFSIFGVGWEQKDWKLQPFGKLQAFWNLFIAAQIWCNQSSPWKVIKKRQATNAQGWIVLLKEASLCSADNQMNGCADRSLRGSTGSPIPFPSLGSVSLPIGAHNPISANGSYAPALLETIDPPRGTIVPGNRGGKHDCLFPAAIQEGQAEPPELFLCEAAEPSRKDSACLLHQWLASPIFSSNLSPAASPNIHTKTAGGLPSFSPCSSFLLKHKPRDPSLFRPSQWNQQQECTIYWALIISLGTKHFTYIVPLATDPHGDSAE